MRVTQSMLSNNMLRNLNSSYSKMSKLQDQIDSGSKITRPSDDPVVAIKGMGYRTELGKVEQYSRNMNEVNSWLDTTNESLDQVGSALIRVKELIVQAANDTNTADDRGKIKAEIDQIQLQLQDVGNTKVANKYVFSGTNTGKPLFVEGIGINPDLNKPDGEVKMEVFDGIQIQVNTQGSDMFGDINNFMTQVSTLLGNGSTGAEISGALGTEISNGATNIPALDALHGTVLERLADVGAKQNRVEMMENRLSFQEINVTKQMSLNEDVDYSKAITEMTTQDAIHQAALSVGAKIIQQTLVDFIR